MSGLKFLRILLYHVEEWSLCQVPICVNALDRTNGKGQQADENEVLLSWSTKEGVHFPPLPTDLW